MLSLQKPSSDLNEVVSSFEGTPKRRGHRHKRSFAVSGDFEFLKKDVDLKNAPSNFEQVQRLNDEILTPIVVEKGSFVTGNNSFPSTYETSTEPPCTSPQFFISEEPKFTSSFRNVPDAIINLDDVLKTRPRSFRSHRRTESAPADLQLALSIEKKLRITEELVTEEGEEIEEDQEFEEREDEEEDNHEKNLINNSRYALPRSYCINRKNSQIAREVLREKTPTVNFNEESENHELSLATTTLMSPLKAKCPSPLTIKESPSKVGYNTIKINKQKERYYNSYSKQIPSNGSGNSSIGHYASNISLSSDSCSSYKGTSTPNTPVSTSQGRKINSRMKPFKFESQVYDIKIEETKIEETKIEDSSVRIAHVADDLTTKPSDNISSNTEHLVLLPREILLGEPGNITDPSKSKEYSLYKSKHAQTRSISDPTTLERSKNQINTSKKRQSRLGVIYSLFSKPKR